MLKSKDYAFTHRYLNYYIYFRLTETLYYYNLKKINLDDHIMYNKYRVVDMEVSWYIIVSQDSTYELYEIY